MAEMNASTNTVKFPKRGGETDKLTVTKDGVIYELPETWSLSDAGTFSFRNKLQERAFSHGSDMVGDGKIDGRTISLEFSVKGVTEQEHDETLNEALSYLAGTGYELRAGRTDRVFRVAGISKIKHKYEKGFQQRWSTITLSLLLADPFRYEAQEAKAVFDFPAAATNAVMTVHNLGSADTPLTFRFIPSGTADDITVWLAETKEKFTLHDALLIRPATATVDGREGAVRRDYANSINTFGGVFLHAIPGANHLYYSGGAGTVEVTLRNRWFI